MIDKNKIAILVTAHTNNQERMFMTENLCEKLSKLGYYLCVVSHTSVSEKILSLCNGFVYDSDNSFLVDGNNHPAGHAVAELKSIQDGINYLQSKGFTHVFKTCYDTNPITDFDYIIQKFANLGKKCVATEHTGYLNTLTFFTEIEFLKQTYNFEELRKHYVIIERMWYLSVAEKNLLNDVFSYAGPSDNELLHIDPNEPFHFSFHNGNLDSDNYKEKLK